MAKKMMFAPLIQFFQNVKQGEIINVFSKDLNIVDTVLPNSVAAFVVGFSNIIGSIYLCVVASDIFIVFPCIFLITLSLKLYFKHVKFSLILGKNENAKRAEKTLIDKYKQNYILLLAGNIWFKINQSLQSTVIVIMTLAYCIFGPQRDSSTTGMILTFTLNIDMQIRWTFIALGWIQERFIFFERCFQYTKIKIENGYEKEFQDEEIHNIEQINKKKQQKKSEFIKKEKIENWPSQGLIEFQNFSAGYSQDSQNVLKNLDLKILSGQKIGVVGRTGAGKSSLAISILRFLKKNSGTILIDGEDLNNIELKSIRQKINVILQEPCLFQGTIKENLDPLQQNTEEQIHKVIKQCRLEQLVQQRGGLNSSLEFQGQNLSTGQKQLFAIARAILKKSKVVIIDEATANIDIQTEEFIQILLKKAFQDCTVITIAHRINTIINSDKKSFGI
ncbi:P-loop containing nucleoside triphosphate hydrolase [Pseudocohnilembus persalinus]|uniref:p-loop containing nucleoside triphosphate hydrolase n=1 Tax=Pseudocohnilembus persalinus TaxID=266149 RepID=A0A0V0R187_PSEPJ|nr:P-loop containing nucleoside triphosphate hydrolase [Pseudocohnilembus persalinus]|eukprot:KRX07925.1 P-loop containing nucleoside triphosphate hydrolase [Pseudocohnilembus persalinus]